MTEEQFNIDYTRAVSELKILMEMVSIHQGYFHKFFKGSQKMAFNRYINGHKAFVSEINKLGEFKNAEDIVDGIAGSSLDILNHVWREEDSIEDAMAKLQG